MCFLSINLISCNKDDDSKIEDSDATDVYIVGYENIGIANHTIGKTWENGVETVLSDGVLSSLDTSLFVLDNTVYVLANTYSGNSVTPKIWKNGIEEPLISSTESTFISDIYS